MKFQYHLENIRFIKLKTLKILKQDKIQKIKTILKYSSYVFSILCLIIIIKYNKIIFHKIQEKTRYYLYERNTEKKLSESIAYIKNKLANHHPKTLVDTIDFVREFVYHNSAHIIDENHDKQAYNSKLSVNNMVDFNKALSAEKPHMACGPRAYAMQLILDSLRIKNRKAQIFSDKHDEILGHIFVEVFYEGKYHIQDPDYNCFYLNANRERINLATLILKQDLTEIQPADGHDKIGWEANGISHLKEEFFGAGRIGSTIFVNVKKFQINKRFSANKNKTLFEFYDKYHIIRFHAD